VARETRAQRRAARAEQAGAPPRRPAKPTADGEAGARRGRPPAPSSQPRRGRFAFFGESWAELQKVEWPGQSQVIQATVVVLIACIVVGAYLYANDIVWKHVGQKILNQ
jgi:preprotein translocase SecE subunit